MEPYILELVIGYPIRDTMLYVNLLLVNKSTYNALLPSKKQYFRYVNKPGEVYSMILCDGIFVKHGKYVKCSSTADEVYNYKLGLLHGVQKYYRRGELVAYEERNLGKLDGYYITFEGSMNKKLYKKDVLISHERYSNGEHTYFHGNHTLTVGDNFRRLTMDKNYFSGPVSFAQNITELHVNIPDVCGAKLPVGLEVLSCYLSNEFIIPRRLRKLVMYCDRGNFVPPEVETLECINFDGILRLPSNIKKLVLRESKPIIDKFPQSLTAIHYREVGLQMPKLPPNLISLKVIDCGKIQLPRLPKSLKVLNTANCKVAYYPYIPESVIDICGCSGNVSETPISFPSLKEICCRELYNNCNHRVCYKKITNFTDLVDHCVSSYGDTKFRELVDGYYGRQCDRCGYGIAKITSFYWRGLFAVRCKLCNVCDCKLRVRRQHKKYNIYHSSEN